MTHPHDFAPYFRSHLVDRDRDAALMERAHQLRFNVYCVECHFLPAADHPDGGEHDEHDANSAHFCALNLRQEMVGYVRLVRPDMQMNFPFSAHGPLVDDFQPPPAEESAEISRLMVRQDYRRRRGDLLAGVPADHASGEAPDDRRDASPQILLSLYREMYAFSLANGIRYWYAAMERSLARVLARMNFAFVQVGPQVDYYGPVAPYVADLRQLEAFVAKSNPPLWDWLRDRRRA